VLFVTRILRANDNSIHTRTKKLINIAEVTSAVLFRRRSAAVFILIRNSNQFRVWQRTHSTSVTVGMHVGKTDNAYSEFIPLMFCSHPTFTTSPVSEELIAARPTSSAPTASSGSTRGNRSPRT
jgi:hypothetical protein